MSKKLIESQSDRYGWSSEKTAFIDSLCSDQKKGGRGPFERRMNVLAFAAAYCLHKKGKPSKLKKRDGDLAALPSVAEGIGIFPFIKMLAFVETKDREILSNNNEQNIRRIRIFEQYANTGIRMLEKELKGEVKISKKLIQIILNTSDANPFVSEELFLSKK